MKQLNLNNLFLLLAITVFVVIPTVFYLKYKQTPPKDEVKVTYDTSNVQTYADLYTSLRLESPVKTGIPVALPLTLMMSNSVLANKLTVADGTLLVYEFTNSNAALAASKKIYLEGTKYVKDDGTILNLFWEANPTFYQKGKVIAIFTGTDKETLKVFTKLLGAPLSLNPADSS